MNKDLGKTLRYCCGGIFFGSGVIKKIWLDDDGAKIYEIQEVGGKITSHIHENKVVQILK